MQKFGDFAFGIIAALLAVATIVGATRTLAWKHYTDRRSFYADAAGAYLFGPSGVVGADGQPVSRQQLLDSYLHAQIEAHPEWKLRFVK